jgi:hypothetical protein
MGIRRCSYLLPFGDEYMAMPRREGNLSDGLSCIKYIGTGGFSMNQAAMKILQSGWREEGCGFIRAALPGFPEANGAHWRVAQNEALDLLQRSDFHLNLL